MHPTVADVASPFLPSIRHAKSAPPCKAKTLANAQVFRASTAEIYPLNFTKTLNYVRSGGVQTEAVMASVSREQFKIRSELEVVHIPTGAIFSAYPYSNPDDMLESVRVIWCRADAPPDAQQVRRMALQLLLEQALRAASVRRLSDAA